MIPTKRNPHGLGIIVDDSPKVVHSLTAMPRPARPRRGKTVVRITEIENKETA